MFAIQSKVKTPETQITKGLREASEHLVMTIPEVSAGGAL